MKSPLKSDIHQQAWRLVQAATAQAAREAVALTVMPMADDLSDRFYTAMLADAAASQILDHQLVNRRLHASMARWVRQLFDTGSPADEVVAVQVRTGEVHARVGVSSEMVAQGARVLKRAISEQLTHSAMSRQELAEAILYVHEVVDLAIDIMNAAYARDADRIARSDEAYRLFFLSQNMKAERERQKSQLLEWAQQILVQYYWQSPGEAGQGRAQGFNQSQFGMWLQHKASMLFEDAPELAQIEALTEVIEDDLLPLLCRARDQPAQARGVVGQITSNIDRIKALLGSMFDRYIEVEDGRDNLTNLLSRRYLPSVAQREITLAQRQGGGFAALMLEIDGFEGLRDTLGLEAADQVLAQVAAHITDRVRAGDFVFRLAEAQFLVLAVEIQTDMMLPLAESLRETILATPLRTTSHASASVTVCIGTALFDGHPDYQRLVDRACEALRAAQAQGGNRCLQAD